MTVQNIIDAIYAFEGNATEWLVFEKEININVNKLSEEDAAILVESDAMEHLLMICDGIRFENSENA